MKRTKIIVALLTISFTTFAARTNAQRQPRGYSIPLIDLAGEKQRQIIVDREPGQYLGHPTTALLEDKKTIIAVYPKGHGRGAILMKRSTDGGLTWSERLPTPKSWETSLETPTVHRVVDAKGKKRLILFSGLYPIRSSISEDDGKTWSELKSVGDFGGIVAMGFVEKLRTGRGHYLAMFHDDGRFFTKNGKNSKFFTLYQTISKDGGLTWYAPTEVFKSKEIHLCEPGAIRSPNGKQIAVLLRENRRVKNSHVIFSNDEGKTWTQPRELPGSLTGDRHTGKYAPDGRLFISFRDMALETKTKGDWVGWVGTYDDLARGREGQYRLRLMDNQKSWNGGEWDSSYPGVEILSDGTFVTTTYGHWIENEPPFIASVRFNLKEVDAKAKMLGKSPGDNLPEVCLSLHSLVGGISNEPDYSRFTLNTFLVDNPTNNTFRKFVDKTDESINFLNSAVREIARVDKAVTYIDLYAEFVDSEGRLDNNTPTTDCICWAKALYGRKFCANAVF